MIAKHHNITIKNQATIDEVNLNLMNFENYLCLK